MLTLDPDTLLFAGDWHANIKWAKHVIRETSKTNIKNIIQVGDFGFGFFKDRELHALNDLLSESGLTLYVLRGNHDSTDFLYGAIDSPEPWQILSNLVYLPDAYRLKIGNYIAVVAGGAGSIDRSSREPRVDWWEDELLSLNSLSRILDDGPADIVLSHDVPLEFPLNNATSNIVQYYLQRDPTVLRYCQEHQSALSMIVKTLHPSLLIHGHHHTVWRKNVNGTIMCCLDMDGTSLKRNTATFADLAYGTSSFGNFQS